MPYHASVSSARDRTQDFVHDVQRPHKLSYISRLNNLGLSRRSTRGSTGAGLGLTMECPSQQSPGQGLYLPLA